MEIALKKDPPNHPKTHLANERPHDLDHADSLTVVIGYMNTKNAVSKSGLPCRCLEEYPIEWTLREEERH